MMIKRGVAVEPCRRTKAEVDLEIDTCRNMNVPGRGVTMGDLSAHEIQPRIVVFQLELDRRHLIAVLLLRSFQIHSLVVESMVTQSSRCRLIRDRHRSNPFHNLTTTINSVNVALREGIRGMRIMRISGQCFHSVQQSKEEIKISSPGPIRRGIHVVDR
jgi:hypothetical protein